MIKGYCALTLVAAVKMYTILVCLVLAGLLVNVALTDGGSKPKEDGYNQTNIDYPYPKKDDYQPKKYDGQYQPKKYDDNYQPKKHDDNYQPKKYDDNYQPKKHDDNYQPKKYDDNYQPKKYDDNYQPKKYDDNYQPKKYDDNYQPKKYDDNYKPKKYDDNYKPKKYDDNYQPKKYDDNYKPKKYDDYDQNKDGYYKPEKCKGNLPAGFVEKSFKTCQNSYEEEYGEYYAYTEPSTYAFDPDCPNSFLQKVPWVDYYGNVVYVYVYMPAAPGTVFNIEKCSLVHAYVKPYYPSQYPEKKPVY